MKIGPILVILWPNSTRMGKKWAQVPLILTQFVENHLELNSNSSILCEHRKLLLGSIGNKSMDEEELRLKHESAIKSFKEGEHG